MISFTIAYVGMTHLGLISAIAAAEKGFDVVCFDPDPRRIDPLKAGLLPVVEPSLPELLQKNSARLHFTFNPADLQRCDLIYVAPDVPTDDQGQSDLKPVQTLIEQVTPFLNKQANLIILSQVPPGFTRKIQWPESQLFYQVETLIFGMAVERALQPERFMVGTAHPDHPLPEKLLYFLHSFSCPIFRMKYESAELSKIAINLFLVSSVSTANTLAELCEKIGADLSEIIPTLQLDKRIGKHAYLAPGLGLSGGNLERDLATFCALSDLHGTDSGVIRAWQANSNHRQNWVLQKIHEKVLLQNKKPTFAILGLSYKKNTASLKNSPSLALLSNLQSFSIRAYDPAVKSLPAPFSSIQTFPSAQAAYQGADVLVVMTPWDEFSQLSMSDIAKEVKTIIDPYGIFSEKECKASGLNYYRLGVS